MKHTMTPHCRACAAEERCYCKRCMAEREAKHKKNRRVWQAGFKGVTVRGKKIYGAAAQAVAMKRARRKRRS